MNRSSSFIFLFLIFAWCKGEGQQTNTVIPPSPDAAALGMYGNLPVSTYTGMPNISIPVYEISFGDKKIPLDLSYHASGITVEQDASWVGLGWTLNVGGVITRTVKGGDDLQFSSDGFSDLGAAFSGYLGYPYDPSDNSSNFFENVCNRNIDAEPDIFYFNFFGKAGSFVFEKGQNQSLDYLVGTPIKGEKIDIRYIKTDRKWRIRTADGYIYYFGTMEVTETLHGVGKYGEGPEPIVFNSTDKGFLSWDDIVVTGWYLDKMISPIGEEIIYTYDVVNEVVGGTPSGRKYSLYGSARISINDINNTWLKPNAIDNCYIPSLQTTAVKTFTNHIYLKEIKLPQGKISFQKSLREDMIPGKMNTGILQPGDFPYLIHNPFYMTWFQFGPQKLDNIEVLDDLNSLIKRIELDLGYFNQSSIGQDKYNYRRLKLKGVRECSGSGCKPYYTLSYDENHTLPSKYSNSQDFWGYYNGAGGNISRIPFGTYYEQTTNKLHYLGDSDRQPNGLFATTGTLKKIVYPTGGSTEFEFESHDYSFFANGAFTLTDFENNTPTPILSETTAEGGPPFHSQTFTLSQPSQELIIDGMMTYFESATSSTPCNVVDPGTIYAGNELWYSLYNVTTGAYVTSRNMSDFLTFFSTNYANNCAIPYRPEAIDPIYRNRQTFSLGAGTYELKVYSRQRFNIYIVLSTNFVRDRIIATNGQGIIAKTAGGIRIKRITHNDNNTSITQIKRYVYNSLDGNGSKKSTGRLMLYPDYHAFDNCTGGVVGDEPIVSIIGRSWSNTPLGNSASGSTVGYDNVTELHGENGENGFSVFNYVNQEEEVVEQQHPIFIEGLPTRTRTSNGLLKSVEYKDNNSVTLKSETYEYIPQLQKFIKGIATKQRVVLTRSGVYSGCSPFSMVSQDYNILSDRWVPLFKTEKHYDKAGGSPLETVTYYVYDTQTHLQLKSEQSKSSKEEVIDIEYKYPSDADWIPPAMWSQKFMYTNIVEKRIFVNGNLSRTYKASYQQLNEMFLLSKEESSIGAAPLEVINEYKYFSSGRISEQKGRDGIANTFLWGFNNVLLLAVIKNAKLSDVLNQMGNITEPTLNGFSMAAFPSQTYLSKVNSLRANIINARINTFSYIPMIGIKSASNENGVSTSYEYDDFGRLKTIRDKNGAIVKQFEYQLQTFAHNGSVWQTTGQTQCKPCAANAAYITNILQNQEKDNNPNSLTFNQTRWVDAGASGSCVSLADWQNTSDPLTCELNGYGQNTGQQYQKQIDVNPCSSTYLSPRWISAGTNTTACPLPEIYAKISYVNEVYGLGQINADVIVEFYSDDSYTNAVAVNNLNINYQIERILFGGPPSNQNYSRLCNGNMAVIATNVLIFREDPRDPSRFSRNRYILLEGTGYHH
jgi:YD repeat-containing protein